MAIGIRGGAFMWLRKSFKAAFAYLCCGFCLFYLAGRFSPVLLNASFACKAFFFFWPLFTSFIAGWHCGDAPWRKGAAAAGGVWVFISAFLIWFLPELMEGKIIGVYLLFCLGGGGLAGAFGFNLHLAKKNCQE
jgi:hypothetical protein